MTAEAIDRLAAAWIEEATENANPAPDGVSYLYSDELASLISRSPVEAWLVLKAVSHSNMAIDTEAAFGMGPLSSFVFHNGLDFSREIMGYWDESSRFRDQFKMVVFEDLAVAILGAKWRTI